MILSGDRMHRLHSRRRGPQGRGLSIDRFSLGKIHFLLWFRRCAAPGFPFHAHRTARTRAIFIFRAENIFSSGKFARCENFRVKKIFARSAPRRRFAVFRGENAPAHFFCLFAPGARTTCSHVHPKSDGKFSKSAFNLIDGALHDSHRLWSRFRASTSCGGRQRVRKFWQLKVARVFLPSLDHGTHTAFSKNCQPFPCVSHA